MESATLIVEHARQLLTLVDRCHQVEEQIAPSYLGLIPDGAVVASGDTIVWVGPTDDVPSHYRQSSAHTVDATSMVVTPGFIDPHTHVIFGGTREHEFDLRCAGISYEEIARRGGGILSSVAETRAASEEELFQAARARVDRMLQMGTTTIEVKSGYGLDTQTELKMLAVARRLDQQTPADVVATFLGAHSVPMEHRSDRDRYLDLVTGEMIPEVARLGLARFCDVFCEENVFTVEEARRVLQCGQQHGLQPKLHAEQLHPFGGADLAAELGAVSVDHLECATGEQARRLAEAGVVGVLLPGATMFLGMKQYAPARTLLDSGVRVALATDCNPGSCMSEALPLMMTLACTQMGMRPAEVIRAVTTEAAAALDLGVKTGRLREGMKADLVLFDIPTYHYIPYHFGVSHARTIVKGGRVIDFATPGGS